MHILEAVLLVKTKNHYTAILSHEKSIHTTFLLLKITIITVFMYKKSLHCILVILQPKMGQ